MRVLQLIDSLNPGGAERMAVNIANLLSTKIEASFLCTTREEGLLKVSLCKNVGYLFLKKTSTIDLKAINKLNKFVKNNNIKVIHAHSTSFFSATIIKILNPKIVLIWHDHYGDSENLNKRKIKTIRFCSKYFEHVISVNRALGAWAKKHLKTKSVSYLPNFAILDNLEAKTKLTGVNSKRILHLANLRPQKDHETLFKAFSMVIKDNPDWTLHCVGKDFNDFYSNSIRDMIQDMNLQTHVFFYGSKPDIANIISQSTIGVLSSKSEGLPITLLEYGLSKLPVIITNVGDCNQVVSSHNEGLLIEPKNHKALASAMIELINDVNLRKVVAQNLYLKVLSSFSELSCLESLIKTYKKYQK